jgi:hypothetical protein
MSNHPVPTLDDDRGWRGWLLTLVALPLGLLLLVPLAIVVAVWFYLMACVEGVRLLGRAIGLRRRAPPGPIVVPPSHHTHAAAPRELPKG